MKLSKKTAKRLIEISRQHHIRPSIMAEVRRLILQDKYWHVAAEVDQALGKALGYPFYADDQKNFPGATEANGVCTGEHVPESLADEAAKKIITLNKLLLTYGEHAASCPVLICSVDRCTCGWEDVKHLAEWLRKRQDGPITKPTGYLR